jgi:hypothetical protein
MKNKPFSKMIAYLKSSPSFWNKFIYTLKPKETPDEVFQRHVFSYFDSLPNKREFIEMCEYIGVNLYKEMAYIPKGDNSLMAGRLFQITWLKQQADKSILREQHAKKKPAIAQQKK